MSNVVVDDCLSKFSKLSRIEKGNFLISLEDDSQKIFLRQLLPTNYWSDIKSEVFNIIYNMEEFHDYAINLLNQNEIKINQLKSKQIEYFGTTSWGNLFLLNNPNILNYAYYIIDPLIKNEIIDYMELVEVFKKCKIYSKLVFIYYSLQHDKPLADRVVINLLENNHYRLPKWFLIEEKTKKLIKRNFNFFFDFELEQKMKLIDIVGTNTALTQLKKYGLFYNLYKIRPEINEQVDHFLSNVIISGEEDKLLPYLSDKTVYLDSGTTTHAYCVEDKVLKLTLQKYCPNAVKDFFLLAPTKTIEIKNDKYDFHLTIELQNYLPKVKNGRKVTKFEIHRFLKELEKQGYLTDDPNNLNLKSDNFGYLLDYHDANLTGIESTDDLPKWFKKRPLVLYDIDKIYKKEITK